jgi:uncharacterized protein (TIGR02118 family)
MIKVSIMYPNTPGVQFDLDYYRDKHLPLIQRRLGAGLKYYTIDKGLTGETTPYVAMCHLICDSLEAYRSSRAPHAEEIRGDISNFTNQTPVTQISEVVVENSSGSAPRVEILSAVVPIRTVFNGSYSPSTAASHSPPRIARHRGVRRHVSFHLEG